MTDLSTGDRAKQWLEQYRSPLRIRDGDHKRQIASALSAYAADESRRAEQSEAALAASRAHIETLAHEIRDYDLREVALKDCLRQIVAERLAFRTVGLDRARLLLQELDARSAGQR